MDIMLFLLSYVLPAVVGIVLIWLLFVAIDAFGFLVTMAILFCISGGILLVCKILEFVQGTTASDENNYNDYLNIEEDDKDKDQKKWGYRQAGRFDLKPEGGMNCCSKCKHYSTLFCDKQFEAVDANHICDWYEEE